MYTEMKNRIVKSVYIILLILLCCIAGTGCENQEAGDVLPSGNSVSVTENIDISDNNDTETYPKTDITSKNDQESNSTTSKDTLVSKNTNTTDVPVISEPPSAEDLRENTTNKDEQNTSAEINVPKNTDTEQTDAQLTDVTTDNEPTISSGSDTEPDDSNSESNTPIVDTDSIPTNTQTADTSTDKDVTVSTSTKNNTASSDSQPNNSETEDSDDEPADTPVTPSVNTDITPISESEYYGRKWLSKQSNATKLLAVYDELVAGVATQKAKITFSTQIQVSISEFETVWSCYHRDYPQHFWLKNQYKYYYSSKKLVTSVVPTYTVTSSNLPSAKAKFENAKQTLLDGIDGSMTQFEIEKLIHDRLVMKCKYNEATHAHDAYGAMVDDVTVCEGFAKAFVYLCREIGIEAFYVSGTSVNASTNKVESHGWNVVKINGDYYHVDTTWDNADTEEEPNGEIRYAYFNVTTEMIQKDHIITGNSYEIPVCTAIDENYYAKTDSLLKTLTVDGVVNCAKKQGDTFICDFYVMEDIDVIAWFRSNMKSIAEKLGLKWYSYYLKTLGNEVNFKIIKN